MAANPCVFKTAILLGLFAILAGCNSAEINQGIEFTFDGNECRMTGSAELPAGEHDIPLNNLTEQDIYLWIGQALDGKTWQDGLDLQSYPTEWVPAPEWLPKAKITFHKYDKDTGKTFFRYTFESEGEYHAWAENKSAFKLWPCAPFKVIKKASD